MPEKKNIQKNFQFALVFVVLVWLVFLFNLLTPFWDLNRLGIYPRNVSGLLGIITAPFLHGNFAHIISNTVPLFVLLLILFIFYEKIALNVLIILYGMTGLLVWIFARNAIHIGASGLVYALAGFLCVLGFFRKDVKSIIISLAVFLLYGGLVWGVLPVRSYISWESHLLGAITGVLTAYFSRNIGYERKEKKS